MKKISILLSLMVIGFITFGQNVEKPTGLYNNEIGINATHFIKNYLNFSENDYYYFGNPSYYLDYKRLINKGALRISLGGNYTLDKDTGGYNSSTNFITKAYYLNALMGYEFRKTINNHWMYYYGIHLVLGYNKYSSENLEPSNGRRFEDGTIKEYGGGPVLGVQFYLNKRLSISTETTLYMLFSKQEEYTTYPMDPEYSKEELHEYTNMQFRPPFNVTLNILL